MKKREPGTESDILSTPVPPPFLVRTPSPLSLPLTRPIYPRHTHPHFRRSLPYPTLHSQIRTYQPLLPPPPPKPGPTYATLPFKKPPQSPAMFLPRPGKGGEGGRLPSLPSFPTYPPTFSPPQPLNSRSAPHPTNLFPVFFFSSSHFFSPFFHRPAATLPSSRPLVCPAATHSHTPPRSCPAAAAAYSWVYRDRNRKGQE